MADISKTEKVWQSIFDSKILHIEIHSKSIYVALQNGELSIISLDCGKRVGISEFVGILSQFQIVSDYLLLVTAQGMGF